MTNTQITELAKVFKLSEEDVKRILKSNKVVVNTERFTSNKDWQEKERCNMLSVLLVRLETHKQLSVTDMYDILHADSRKLVKFSDIYTVLNGKFAKLIKAQPCFKYSTIKSEHVSNMLYSEDFAKIFYKAWKTVTGTTFSVTKLLDNAENLDKISISALRKLIK